MKMTNIKKAMMVLTLGLGIGGAFSATANGMLTPECQDYLDVCYDGDFEACTLFAHYCDLTDRLQ
jgi:hypothetical protein